MARNSIVPNLTECGRGVHFFTAQKSGDVTLWKCSRCPEARAYGVMTLFKPIERFTKPQKEVVFR